MRNVWGYDSQPDHNNRRCIDYMILNHAGGDFVAEYLWTHRKRLGLELLIWDRRIRRTYAKGLIPMGRWARYKGPHPHTDHVHAQTSRGAYSPPRRTFLGPYVVDPGQVDTFLWQIRPDGSQGAKRPPGFRITTGVRIVKRRGVEWLETVSGNRYALAYLRRAP